MNGTMNGSKFAAIAVVVLLAAAGLYYAFVAPSTPPDSAPVGANGLGTPSATRPATPPPPLRTVGAAPSANTSTPALRALGGESNGPTGASTTNGFANGGTPAPTTVGGAARAEQPVFQPGSLAAGGTGKGDGAPASTQTPITAPAASNAPTRVAGNGFNNGFDAPITSRSTPGAAGASPTTPTTTPTTAPTTTTPTSPTPTTLAGNGGVPSTPPTIAPTTPRTTPNTASGATPSTSESTHTVASGETMSSIAKRYFGSENKWTLIAKANPSIDPSSMKVGSKLRIPAHGAVTVAAGSGSGATPKSPATTPGATASGGSHVIASGDTLSSLARKYYGSAKHWRKIYDANRTAIGSDPAALKVGQSLVIPSRTAVVGAENVER